MNSASCSSCTARGHENVGRAVEAWECDDVFTIVYECYQQDIYTVLSDRGKFADREAACFVLQLLRAVDYVHSRGFGHEDIRYRCPCSCCLRAHVRTHPDFQLGKRSPG